MRQWMKGLQRLPGEPSYVYGIQHRYALLIGLAPGRQGVIMFEELKEGSQVHYVQLNGVHSNATVTQIHNQKTGVVDLHVTREEASFQRIIQ